MNRPRLELSFATLAVAAALALAGDAHADGKRWFLGSDKVYVRLHGDLLERVQEPDVHLDRARRSYVKNHRSIAADELEKAAAGFAYFAERAAGGQHKELQDAERALNKLADDVRAGRLGEVTNLDRALADARRILAGDPPPAPQPSPAPQ